MIDFPADLEAMTERRNFLRTELERTEAALSRALPAIKLSEQEADELVLFMAPQWIDPNAFPLLKNMLVRLETRPRA